MWEFLIVCAICVTIYNLAYLFFDYLKIDEEQFIKQLKDSEDEY